MVLGWFLKGWNGPAEGARVTAPVPGDSANVRNSTFVSKLEIRVSNSELAYTHNLNCLRILSRQNSTGLGAQPGRRSKPGLRDSHSAGSLRVAP
jgi:hypothetical protein